MKSRNNIFIIALNILLSFIDVQMKLFYVNLHWNVAKLYRYDSIQKDLLSNLSLRVDEANFIAIALGLVSLAMAIFIVKLPDANKIFTRINLLFAVLVFCFAVFVVC